MIHSTPTSGNIAGAGGILLLVLLGGTLLYFSVPPLGHAPPPTVQASSPVIDYEVTTSDITVDWEAGGGDLSAQAGHRDELEQVVVFPDAVAGIADKRIFVRRLLERPGRVSREQAERPERDPAARDEMQRDLDLQARQMCAGK